MSDHDRLVECFQVVFPFLDVQAIPATTRTDLDQWDSLASINLLTVVEEEFNLMFPDDAIEGLVSFDAVLAAVRASAGV